MRCGNPADCRAPARKIAFENIEGEEYLSTLMLPFDGIADRLNRYDFGESRPLNCSISVSPIGMKTMPTDGWISASI